MSFAIGERLGPYEILAPIGAGGMGEVYRARDTRLNRDVAIKVSKEQFTERFAREARSIAALNHTNICHLYDVGPNYLVMEYVEGAALKGPLPLDEALPIIQQLIDGIEAAHEKNIVHRDLKPANIKITPEGVVKILDFGLAKAMESPREEGSPENSPTLTIGATEAGTILGTASYMAPEQAKGKAADRRSDIWSFGVVVYELLTGKRPFDGETVVETLAAVLNKDPDWAAVPASARRLLRRCLERDRKRRLGAISDSRWMLEEALETAVPAPARSRFSVELAITAVVLLVALVALAFVHFRETSASNAPLHLSVALPENTTPGHFALSPDGRLLVINYRNQLWLRALDSLEIHSLAGTEGARTPFWSPDSKIIGFFADAKLKTILATGGPSQTLCSDTGIGNGGTWNRKGMIVFGTEARELYRVPETGGTCTPLIKSEPDAKVTAQSQPRIDRWLPVFLPDGEHFLYVLRTDNEVRRGLYLASLHDPAGRRLLADQSSAVFVPSAPGASRGHLLFQRESTLMAQPFDAGSLQLTGDPFSVADQVSGTSTPPQVAASASENGTVVYLVNRRPDRQLIWFDRSGKEMSRVGTPGNLGGISLSPDGKQVAFGRTDASGVPSLWVRDLERNTETRITMPPVEPGASVWSPDGRKIAFGSPDGMHVKDLTGGGKEEVLLHSTNRIIPSDWSHDGRSLIYTETDPKTGGDIWILPDALNPSADRKPIALLRTPFTESQGQWSPDGKWLAYSSDESGTPQVYIRAFPSSVPFENGTAETSQYKRQVSTVSGSEPRWRADGKELFYLDNTGYPRLRLMAATISTGTNPTIEAPKPLFEFRTNTYITQMNEFIYNSSPDGQRFLVRAYATEARAALEVLVNWQKTLAK